MLSNNLTFIDCGEINAPINGAVTYSSDATTYGETATFTCDAGYDLTGAATRTCLAEEIWSGSSPVCTVRGKTMLRV